MKIIILGAGQVGASVAENLVSEANDITLVDTSEEYLAALRERLEIRTVCGNAASPRVLREAREAFERMYFEHHLRLEGGNMTRLAEKTGLERTHLYRKLKQLGLQAGRRHEEN